MARSAPDGPRFSPDLYRFLRELAKNNNRDWFLENKPRYDAVVRAPCLEFIREVGPGIGRLSKYLVADDRPSGGSLYRIYRDVRFAKDKSPYKTTVGIHFYHVGADSHGGNYPGFYLHLGPKDNFVGAGLWGPDPVALNKIRSAIADDPARWKKARVAPLAGHGEVLKRVPTGFSPDHPMAADLKHKDFVVSLEVTDREVLDPKFPGRFLAACAELDPMNRFLARAVGIEY